MTISQRAQRTPTLPTQRDAATIRHLEQTGVHVWKLHQGDPQFATPEILSQEFKTYSEKTLGYPGAAGLPEHVAAWKKMYKDQGIASDALHIIPTCGAAEAIHMALFTITDPGDEILVFEPIYSGFSVIAGMLDCRFVPIQTSFETDFSLPDQTTWAEKVTNKTKALILINPDNPTGRALTLTQVEQVALFAEAHQLTLIVDETYRALLMDPSAATLSALSLTRFQDRLIVLDSLSKSAGVPGMRIGILATYNTELYKNALKFAMSRSGTGRIEQRLSIPLLTDGSSLVARNRAELRSRIEACIQALKQIPNIELFKPHGGMFVIARLPGINTPDLLHFFLETFRHEQQTASFLSLEDFYISKDLGTEELRIAAIYPAEQLKEAIRIFGEGVKAYRQFHETTDASATPASTSH